MQLGLKKYFKTIFLLLLFFFLLPGRDSRLIHPEPVHATASENESNNGIIGFQPVGGQGGWLIENRSLYWLDSEREWRDITPNIQADRVIESVFFVDEQTGWVVSTYWLDNTKYFELLVTLNGGVTWEKLTLDDFLQDRILSDYAIFQMQWVDEKSGKLLFKKQTGNNFSQGFLLITDDGGSTWEMSLAPAAEFFVFINKQTGYLRGLDGLDLYQTFDGGSSWQEIGSEIYPDGNDSRMRYSLPEFTVEGFGLLPIIEENGYSSYQIVVLSTNDWGQNWQNYLTVPLGESANPQLPVQVNLIDRENFRIWVPNTHLVFGQNNGEYSELQIDSDNYHISKLFLINHNEFWGEFTQNICEKTPLDDTNLELVCSEQFYIAISKDAGQTWEKLVLPAGKEVVFKQTENIVESLASADRAAFNTEVFIGQGFDKCEIPSISQMQTWMDRSPYGAVNLYIGGVARACDNKVLNKEYVAQLYEQGWKFIPTWVGPQAPCTSFTHRMSWDTSTAYQQGMDNAAEAVQVLSDLGFTFENKAGSLVYYDIEVYYGTEACYDAVAAFMDGWTFRLHQLGNKSGIYGASCGSHIVNFFSLPNSPDVIWPAAWYNNPGSGYYDPDATVWDLPCVSNSYYNNHQRIRQYEGDHSENWGGTSLVIDSDVLDGVIAVPNTLDTTPPKNPTSINPGCTANNGEWQNFCKDANFSWSGASDSGSGVAGYQYYWGTVRTGTSTKFTTGTSFNPPAVGEGIYYFRIRTKDNAGNFAPWKTMYVLRYDGTAPTGSLMINDNDAAAFKTLVSLKPSGKDNLSGVRMVRFRDQGGSWTAWRGIKEILWVLPDVTNQSHTIEAQIKDSAGNISPLVSDSIILDIYPERPLSFGYRLIKSTFGMSTTSSFSEGYKLQGTLSQPSTIGSHESGGYQLISGFWSWLKPAEKLINFLIFISK